MIVRLDLESKEKHYSQGATTASNLKYKAVGYQYVR